MIRLIPWTICVLMTLGAVAGAKEPVKAPEPTLAELLERLPSPPVNKAGADLTCAADAPTSPETLARVARARLDALKPQLAGEASDLERSRADHPSPADRKLLEEIDAARTSAEAISRDLEATIAAARAARTTEWAGALRAREEGLNACRHLDGKWHIEPDAACAAAADKELADRTTQLDAELTVKLAALVTPAREPLLASIRQVEKVTPPALLSRNPGVRFRAREADAYTWRLAAPLFETSADLCASARVVP